MLIEDAKNPQIAAQPILFRNDKNSRKLVDAEIGMRERAAEFHALP